MIESSAAELKRVDFKCERTKKAALEFMPDFHKKSRKGTEFHKFIFLNFSCNDKLDTTFFTFYFFIAQKAAKNH